MLPPAPLPLAPPATARFQHKRDTILVAAARQFNAQGIKGATLAEIAGSVDLVTTSITYYYRRKDDLATACFVPAIAAHQRVALAAAAEPTVSRWLAGLVGLHARRLAAIASGQQPAATADLVQ